MDKQKVYYKNKPQRKSGYDYDLPGAYFVTICLKNRRNLFGEIKNEKIVLYKPGEVANKCWSETPSHFENTTLGEHIVMPNHFHGIIYIYDASVGQTHAFDSIKDKQESTMDGKKTEQIQRMHKRLSIIIGSFKSAVTKEINKSLPELKFEWQTSFYDHIIRDDRGLEYISDYIRMNPINWNKDLENDSYISEISVKERALMIKKHYNNLLI